MGVALYVHLMVYTGLSLFIIRWTNVYLIVCVLMCITLQFGLMSNILMDFVFELFLFDSIYFDDIIPKQIKSFFSKYQMCVLLFFIHENRLFLS